MNRVITAFVRASTFGVALTMILGCESTQSPALWPSAVNADKPSESLVKGQFTQALTPELIVVANEVSWEPRSIGSVSLRLYQVANPNYPFDQFVTGTIVARDGTIVALEAVTLEQSPGMVLITQSAGSGGYLNGVLFEYSGGALTQITESYGHQSREALMAALERKIGNAKVRQISKN